MFKVFLIYINLKILYKLIGLAILNNFYKNIFN